MVSQALVLLALLSGGSTANAMSNCNTGNGMCKVDVRVQGQCKNVEYSIDGATGDNCEVAGNNSVENIYFRCKLTGGKAENVSMTKSLPAPTPAPSAPDCAAADKIRADALVELNKRHKGATVKAKEALRVEAKGRLTQLEAGKPVEDVPADAKR